MCIWERMGLVTRGQLLLLSGIKLLGGKAEGESGGGWGREDLKKKNESFYIFKELLHCVGRL